MVVSVLISIIFCAAAVFFLFSSKNTDARKIPAGLMAAAVAAAVGLRVYLALQDYYFTYDINTFKAWGSYVRSLGFGNLYSGDFFLDYPPGYMYVLYILDAVRDILSLPYDHVVCSFIYKLPAMAADFGCGWLIYRFAREKFSHRHSCALFIAYLFVPGIVFNSSVWGQIESWYLFFLALALYFAYRSKTVFAAVVYAAALITKPQSLLFGPVLLFYIVKRKSLRELFKALGTGAVSFYAMALPFCKGPFDVMWLVDLYKGTFQGYRHFTVNAFNLYYLLGLNWTDISSVKGSNVINIFVIAIAIAIVAFVVLAAKNTDGIFAAAAVSISIMFIFCTMMHERYIYPAVLFCVLSYIARNRKGYLVFAGLTGCLMYINSSWIMAMYYQTFDLSFSMERAVSFVYTLTVVAFAVYVLRDIALEYGLSPGIIKQPKVILCTITAVYAVFALNMLGADYAPQTFWQSTDEDFSFRIHFDKPADLGSIYVFSGIGDQFSGDENPKICGEFDVFALSENDSYEYIFTISDQSVYSWKEYTADVTTSSLLIQAKHEGAVLGEIVVTDSLGNTLSGTLDAISCDNPYPSSLAVDESHMRPHDTGYYNSMYFDEIYHGRTAFEQLNGYEIYETTHPPLGKIIISIGIKLFGMTPFGWRIAGALCGIAMIPLVYLLACALTKNGMCGIVASLLTAFDFMHLTQTRIATVDTYVVLFVLLTFLFMAYYSNTDFGSRKEWLYLAASGLFMGCAVASKWNGAYPMIGLAVFFFVRIAFKYAESGRTQTDRKHLVHTILLCFVFFVAVPLAVYSLSFIPVIHTHNPVEYLRELWSYQLHMYDYHANLDAEHFFSSMWYTWPFSIKPIWYSVSELGGMVSTISAFGNPLIWILTPFASVYCLVRGIAERRTDCLLPALGYFASYLPWVMVSRLCFVYHYFPCAVFGIIAMAVAVGDFVKKRPSGKSLLWFYLVLCAVLFIVFLPVTSGIPAPREYIEALEILPQWYFVN